MVHGRHFWIPKKTVHVLKEFKQDLNLGSDVEAWEKIGDYAMVGREVERIKDGFFLKFVRGRK